MKVSVLQVDRCKPILGLNAFDHAPVRQHLERELVQSPVQDSQIQDWPKATTFLGYDEVRAVKPLPHLGWRDRLDCILCQEDSNLLAQDRGVPDCHRRLENAVELGRSPGELNSVAESNCAREPARQAGQREPRLQTLCKRLQRHNRRTCGGAAKGSRGGWHRRRCVLRHPHRTPWVPNGTGQRCVGRNVVPEPYSLGYWQNGSWARVRRQGVAHCRPMDLRTRRKGNCSFFEKVGTAGPWTSGGTETNETEDSPPGPPPGEGAALFSPSPEKEQTPTSPGCPRQGRFVDLLDDLGPGWDAGGAALLREARRTGLCVDSALEDAGGRPRRRAD